MTGQQPWGETWPAGSIANGHVLTEDGWVPFRARSRNSGPPWHAGDLVDGHVLNGTHEWVPDPRSAIVPVPGPRPQSAVERWHRSPIELRIALVLVPIFVGLYVLSALVVFIGELIT